jgi:hypothetical protein
MTQLLFETYPYQTPLSIFSNESRLVSDTINLRRRGVLKMAQRFEFIITVEDGLNSTLHAALMANWLTYGMETPFEIPCPQHLYTDTLLQGGTTSDITVDTTYGLEVDDTIGLSSDERFVIPAGRFITFSNHTKLYAVTATITSVYDAGSGKYEADLQLKPGLKTIITASETVEIVDTVATVLNEADNASFEYRDGIIQSASLKFIEYL